MGAVHLATDEVLGRRVALKRIGHLLDEDSPELRRAEREARIAATLNHAGVVGVYDFVDDGDDRWLVMEYVEGLPLSTKVALEGPLSPDEAAPLVRQVAEALAAAHEADIVHRDVKPSNMLVTDAGQVKLSDFGIARAATDASLTRTGLVSGSPSYLAPEVATGNPATDRSDVWSLGAALFHLLTGKPPYQGDVLVVMHKIVSEDPPRTERAGWLAPLLEATMTRDPERRWTMREVAQFLARGPSPDGVTTQAETTRAETTQVLAPAASSESATVAPVESDPQPTTPAQPLGAPASSAATPRRRNPLPVLLAVGALALLGLLGWLIWQSSNDDEPRADTAPETTSQTPTPTEPTSSPPETTAPPPSTTTAESAQDAEKAASMEAFVEDYLATVTSDPGAAYGRLTPAFQEESGGYEGYTGWWGQVESAKVTNIVANPRAGTVAYTVDYVKKDGSTRSDAVTLVLVERDGGWLIDGEP